MKFYSEVTKQLYDTVGEAEGAEKEFLAKKLEEEAKKAKEKEAYEQQKKELDEARKKYLEAQEVYYTLLNAFNEQHANTSSFTYNLKDFPDMASFVKEILSHYKY